MGATYSARRQ